MNVNTAGLQTAMVAYRFENHTNLGDIVRNKMCGQKEIAHEPKNVASNTMAVALHMHERPPMVVTQLLFITVTNYRGSRLMHPDIKSMAQELFK